VADEERVEKPERGAWLAWAPVVVAGAVVVFILLNTYCDWRRAEEIAHSTTQPAWALRGVMGDFWGGHLGAAAGLAGFLLMFAAFLLQGRELKLQRQELRLQREEYARGIEESERQTKALNAQLEELRGQRRIAERQERLSSMLSMVDELRKLDDKGKDPRPLLEMAIRTILDVAEVDADMASEMFDLMVSCCVWIDPGVVAEKLWEEFEDRWQAYEKGARERVGTWAVSAGDRVGADLAGTLSIKILVQVKGHDT